MNVKQYIGKIIKENLGSFISIFLCVVSIGIIREVFPILFGALLDQLLSQNKEIKAIISVILGYGILFIGSIILHYINNATSAFLDCKISYDIRQGCIDKLSNMNAKDYVGQNFGEYITTINQDSKAMLQFINDCIINGISMTFELLFILGVVYTISPYLLIYLVVGVTISLLLSNLLPKLIKKRYEKERELSGGLNSWLISVLSGMREIKIFQAGDIITQRYENRQTEYLEYIEKTAYKEFTIEKINALLSLLIQIGLIIISGLLIFSDKMTIGNFVSVNVYFATIMAMLRFYGYLAYVSPKCKVSIGKVLQILSIPSEYTKGKQIEGIERIEMEGLTFSYTNKTVIQNMTMQISRGGMISIEGLSGAGKSTLINLLLGFYDDYIGSLKIGDIEVREIDKQALRECISVVQQDGELFYGESIRKNLLIHKELEDKEIMKCCKLACIDEYIGQLPKGLDTIYGKDVFGLSGGQKQRLFLARSLIQNTPIYIFDEATSALDLETEKIILDNMDVVLKNKIVIFVTHRDSITFHAKKKYRIENGQLILVD